tara:strand:+ start:66 stop:452 length:387 start_codon:yes stop_codon:yes gene_type:complete
MNALKKIILSIIGILTLSSSSVNNEIICENDSQSYTFILTHLLGEKLTKDAHFTVGNMKTWELDFRNGDIIKYRIITMNPDNPMCGISAQDNLDDYCDICITKTYGDKVKIEFKYGNKRLTYDGYIKR